MFVGCGGCPLFAVWRLLLFDGCVCVRCRCCFVGVLLFGVGGVVVCEDAVDGAVDCVAGICGGGSVVVW